jgi:hypothetical protein
MRTVKLTLHKKSFLCVPILNLNIDGMLSPALNQGKCESSHGIGIFF